MMRSLVVIPFTALLLSACLEGIEADGESTEELAEQPTEESAEPEPLTRANKSCSGKTCDNKDPVEYGCNKDPKKYALTAANVKQGSKRAGVVTLFYSPKCKAAYVATVAHITPDKYFDANLYSNETIYYNSDEYRYGSVMYSPMTSHRNTIQGWGSVADGAVGRTKWVTMPRE